MGSPRSLDFVEASSKLWAGELETDAETKVLLAL